MLLKSALEGSHPLSEVGFVHDYVQLHFQDLVLNLYSQLVVRAEGHALNQGDERFAGKLIKFLGQRVASVEYNAGSSLSISFSGGSSLVASLRAQDVKGVELFQLSGPGVPMIVERVA